MNKPPPHRFNIWNLVADKTSEPKSSPSEKPSAGVQADRFGNSERLVNTYRGRPLLISAFRDQAPLSIDYDHRQPINIELAGRATMPNGRSTTCKTKKISSESVELLYDLKTASYPLRAPDEIPAGATVFLDVEQIGSFHGTLIAQNFEGFQLAVDPNCRPMLIGKLTQMAVKIGKAYLDEAPLAIKRGIMRIEPNVKNCCYTDYTGQKRKGKIINVSPLDALVKAVIIPPLATQIVFSGKQGRSAEVTRIFEIGFAVQFSIAIPEAEFSPAIKFIDE